LHSSIILSVFSQFMSSCQYSHTVLSFHQSLCTILSSLQII
jgi:hypothetical protein